MMWSKIFLAFFAVLLSTGADAMMTTGGPEGSEATNTDKKGNLIRLTDADVLELRDSLSDQGLLERYQEFGCVRENISKKIKEIMNANKGKTRVDMQKAVGDLPFFLISINAAIHQFLVNRGKITSHTASIHLSSERSAS